MGRGFAAIASSGTGSRVETGRSAGTDGTADGNAVLACHGCGKRHDNAKLMQLPDGMLVGMQSDAWRHYCEVQWALRLPDRVGPRSKRWTKAMYINEVRAKRGDAAADRLRMDLIKAWKAQHEASGTGLVAPGRRSPRAR
jgi:hypothetical protein